MLIDEYLDIDSKYEYKLTLCKPNRKIQIAELNEAYDINYKPVLKEPAQLSFKIPKNIMNKTSHKQKRNPNFDLVKGHFLILMETENIKQYFIILNPKEESGDSEYKEINCYSLEVELNNKYLRNFRGTRQLYKIPNNPESGDGILNLLEEMTTWKVNYLDPKAYIEVINGGEHHKYRTFEFAEASWTQAIDEIEDAFDCVLVFDSYNKHIDVYAMETLEINKGLYISHENHLKHISIDPKYGEIVTRLKVYGKSNLTINQVNTLGTDYIENFSFYMDNGYMSDELLTALKNYNTLVETKGVLFKDYLAQLNTKQSELLNKQTELSQLESDMKIIEDNIGLAIQRGETYSNLNTQKDNKQAEINNKNSEINSVQGQINTINNNITSLRNLIDKKNNFSAELLDELDYFIKEKTWSNQNFYEVNSLYEEGKKALKELNEPTTEFSIDIVNLFNILEGQIQRKKLTIGSVITVNYDNKDIELNLIGYDHRADEGLSVTLSNKSKKKKAERNLANGISRAISASTTMDINKNIWDTAEGIGAWVESFKNSALDASKNAVLAGKDQSIRIDEHGINLSDVTNPAEQLKFINNCFAMTLDEWKTASLAITPRGIVASKIIGALLLGSKLIINNEEGTIQINGDGLYVKTPSNQLKVKLGKLADNSYGLCIYSNSGNVMVDERGIIQTYSFPYWSNIDKNSPMRVPINIDKSAISVNSVKLTINLSGYRTFEKEASYAGGSDKTSTWNGNYSDTLTSYNEEWSNPAGKLPVIVDEEYPNGWIGQASFDHKHRSPINISSHYHTVQFPSHSHPLTFLVYEGARAESIYVKVNGTLVQDNITSNIIELELANYITTGGQYTVEIGSYGTTNNPNGISLVNTNFEIKYFCGM